jgi:hypothetical protein
MNTENRFSDRFITASARHNGIQIRAVGWRYHIGTDKPVRQRIQKCVVH